MTKTRYITVKLTEYEACEITSTMFCWGLQPVTNRIVAKIHEALSKLDEKKS